MKIKEYIIINNGKVILHCANLKDAVECCHKFNKVHSGCKILKVMIREKQNES